MVFSLRTAPTGVGVGAGMTGLDEGAEAADKDEGATVAGLDKGTAAAGVEAARLDLETGGIAEEGLKGWSFSCFVGICLIKVEKINGIFFYLFRRRRHKQR